MTMVKAVLMGVFFMLLSTSFVHAADLVNPLGQTYTIPQIIGNLIKAALSIIGSVTLIVFVYGGTLWLTSAGYEDRVKQGKQTMIWAILGLIMLFASYVLVDRLFVAITPPDAALEYSEEDLFGGPAGRSACADRGGECIAMTACPGPASIDQCLRDKALEIDSAQGALGATTCFKGLCPGTLEGCCVTDEGDISGDAFCALNSTANCAPCSQKNSQGVLMDGYCDNKRCQIGTPPLLSLCALRGTESAPKCYAAQQLCDLPNGQYGICNFDLYCRATLDGVTPCQKVLDITARCMDDIPSYAIGNPSVCVTSDPKICGSARVCCKSSP